MSTEPTNLPDDAQDPVTDSAETVTGAPGAAQPTADLGQQGAPSENNEGEAGSVDMSAFEEQLEDSELSAALAQVAQVEDKLARAHADLYNLNQEYSNYVRRSKESVSGHVQSGRDQVLEALIGVLDDIEAARKHGDLNDGPFASIANKLEDTLKTRFEMERFGDEGDDFDPTIHEALMAQPNPDVDHPVLGQVLQSGYRRGETVIRAAKVLVHNPE